VYKTAQAKHREKDSEKKKQWEGGRMPRWTARKYNRLGGGKKWESLEATGEEEFLCEETAGRFGKQKKARKREKRKGRDRSYEMTYPPSVYGKKFTGSGEKGRVARSFSRKRGEPATGDIFITEIGVP